MKEVFESKQSVVGSTHPDTVMAVQVLARWQQERREREFEENTARMFPELQAGLALKNVHTMDAISNLASIRCRQGRYQEAAALDTAALSLSSKNS